jgi:hypothetical protein
MKSIITAFALFIVALLAGCATAEKLNNIRIGMTKDQVIAQLGKPDSTSAQANIEYLTYYLANEGAYREQPYSVRLVDGKVESFGRFMQLFDIYNRPVSGTPQTTAFSPMGAPLPVIAAPAAGTDLPTALQKLKTLKDQGVLTDEEFQKAKQKLLSDQK